MRPLWIFLILATVTPALARNITKVESSDNRSSDLTSLNYYPHVGRWELIPRVSTAFHDDSKKDNGDLVTTTYNQVFMTVYYGIAPRLWIGISDNLLWDHLNDTLLADGTTGNGTSTGFSNPTLSATFRYLESGRSHISADLTAIVSPSMGAHQQGVGVTNHMGNNLSGNWTAEVGAAAFWRLDDNELSLSAYALRNFEQTTENNTGGQTAVESQNGVTYASNTSPYWVNTVQVIDRFHFSNDFYLNLNATGTLPYEFSSVAKRAMTVGHVPFYVMPIAMIGFRGSSDVVIECAYSYRRSFVIQDSTGAKDVAKEDNLTQTQTTASLTIRHQF